MDIDDVRTEMRGGFKQVDRRFKKIDQQFAKFRSETRKAFKNVDERFNGVYGEFDKLRAVRLDDHDRRIKRLEDPR